MAGYAKLRQRKWSDYVHRQSSEEDLQAIRQSVSTGVPYGAASWVKNLGRKLKLDLTVRPRSQRRYLLISRSKIELPESQRRSSVGGQVADSGLHLARRRQGEQEGRNQEHHETTRLSEGNSWRHRRDGFLAGTGHEPDPRAQA